MKKIVVLISGRGSNLEKIILEAKSYLITAVYSDNPQAAGLKLAEKYQIPTFVFDLATSDTTSRKQNKNLMFKHLAETKPDFIILAGFMKILPAEFIRQFPNRIINIHPSLLPKFPGLNTHQRAIEAKELIHGCTVHYVDEGIDTGEIIAQKSCEICKEETAESLATKVLHLEHQLYPAVLNQICAK